MTATVQRRKKALILPTYAMVFKALSDETRLRIFLLLDYELCVCQIQVALAMTQTRVSRHLTVLRNAGLVAARREGLWIYYSRAVPESSSLRAFLKHLTTHLKSDPDFMASVVPDPSYAALSLKRLHGWEKNNE